MGAQLTRAPNRLVQVFAQLAQEGRGVGAVVAGIDNTITCCPVDENSKHHRHHRQKMITMALWVLQCTKFTLICLFTPLNSMIAKWLCLGAQWTGCKYCGCPSENIGCWN